MTNATITNQPVSIQLNSGEQTTVPTNEVWQVSLAVGGTNLRSNSSNVQFKVNGTEILTLNAKLENGGGLSSPTVEKFVVTGGDTLRLDTNRNGGAGIGGFVVDS